MQPRDERIGEVNRGLDVCPMVAGEEGARLFDGDEKAGGRPKEDERRNVYASVEPLDEARAQSPCITSSLRARSPGRSFL